MNTSPSEPNQTPATRWPILNVWIDDLSMEDLLARLRWDGGTVFTFNPEHAYHLHYNRDFLQAYQTADFITMDSRYLLAAMRLRGMPLKNALPGSDIVPAFFAHEARNEATRVFLLGARPGVAEMAARRINKAIDRPIVVGAHGPSMRFVEDAAECAAVVDMIKASGATALLVALGAPKQELWIAKHRHLLPNVKVFMGVGATVDYEAGVVKRAPKWLRKIGMEWAYRVVTEPRRYLLRYVRNTLVFWWVVQEHRGAYRNAFGRIPEQR